MLENVSGQSSDSGCPTSRIPPSMSNTQQVPINGFPQVIPTVRVLENVWFHVDGGHLAGGNSIPALV